MLAARMTERYVVIMAGGRGERFWPESRLDRPKHLLPIVGESPMLRQTVDRLSGLVPPERVIILTNALQVPAIRTMCPDIPKENIVAEPVGRDTAPAVGLAALLVKKRDPGAVMAVLPSDHVVHDSEGFRKVLDKAMRVAASLDVLVTIGIEPTQAATGYGYIRKGGVFRQEVIGSAVFEVARFVEKPDEETARGYVDSGEYFWNAGMFVWTVRSIEAAMAAHRPGLARGLAVIWDRWQDGEAFDAILGDDYGDLERISIDYAVMEKATNCLVMRSEFDWDDVGEWPAVERHGPKDASGNFVQGLGVLLDASNNIVFNDGNRVTALLGVEDLIVVHTADATLVCPKSRAQEIKKVLEQVKGAESTRGFC